MRLPSSLPASTSAPITAPMGPWSAAQADAVAKAEAIAAIAATEVAAEAATTARAAVDVAAAAAVTAAAKASRVAAQAVVAAAAAAAAEETAHAPASQAKVSNSAVAASTAAAKVAMRVATVAAAAARAAVQAATVIGVQLETDVNAAAQAVAAAAAPPSLAGQPASATLECGAIEPGRVDIPTGAPGPVSARGGPALADELRRGIAGDQLRLHYQPIVDIASGQSVGVEALVRWQHPERGLLPPIEFIELAERTDLVLRLGEWVLQEACRVAASLQTRGGKPLTVAVNLSGRQLSDPGLVATVRAALAASGCCADRLVFEITETASVTDMVAAIASMEELKALGAGIAIDDFGTGYSSLLYLKHMSANDLKIDRAFVRGLGDDAYDTAMVASLISLAHNLNVRCVAEGVETDRQLRLLSQLGCDFAQGYLICAPVDLAVLKTWLDQQVTADATHRGPEPVRSAESARIMAMHRNNLSVLTIAASLNTDGSRTALGRRWTGQSVAQTVALSAV